MIDIKIFDESNRKDIKGKVLDFYIPRFSNQFSELTFNNSAVICLALEDDSRVVGAVRAISDLTRHAMIVDLVVDANHRRQGIGTKLLQAMVSELKRHNIKDIGLTTDPKTPWLPDFYLKNGFLAPDEGCVFLKI